MQGQEPGVAVMSGGGPSAGASIARCPDCPWREGPFVSVNLAHGALRRHIDAKHAALAAFIRAAPMPEGNEAFARNMLRNLISQAVRIDEAAAAAQKISRVVGADGREPAKPKLNVPAEMIEFIRNASKGIAAIMDMVLESRTGQPEIVMLRDPNQQPAKATAPAQEPHAADAR